MPELLRAAFAAPMTQDQPPLLEDAAVVLEGDEILDLGSYSHMKRLHGGPVRDLGSVTLAPATFNSHVHLEMCHLLGRTVSGQGFVPWITSLVSQPLYDLDAARVRAELFRMEQRGVGFLADISTRNAVKVGEILASSGLGFASFSEVIGNEAPADPSSLLPQVRDVDDCGRGVMSLAGHALYSTSPELIRAAKGLSLERGLPFSLHLAEHTDEDTILLYGKSPFLDLLMARGYLTSYTAPERRPVPLAQELGILDEGTLLVHCVTVTDEDVKVIAASKASVCLCPRSNEFIGVGEAPVRSLLDAGVNVCLGTDGLCSNADLDPYGEVAWLLERHPGLDLMALLALITANPARYFGRSIPRARRLGSIAPGQLARFSIVPQAVLDICSHR